MISRLQRVALLVLAAALSNLCAGQATSVPQANTYERTFPQSKAAVEQALKNLQAAMAGRLPVLDGFANAGAHPLERYQRGYYQASVQVTANPGGGSLVRVTMKVTAWYNDPTGHSGYQLLPSNGRLEGDLLDQLSDQLVNLAGRGGNATVATESNTVSSGPAVAGAQATLSPVAPRSAPQPSPAKGKPQATSMEENSQSPTVSAPSPRFPNNDETFSTSVSRGIAGNGLAPPNGANAENRPRNEKVSRELQAEIDGLEEILKNQAHPKNLVAVKKSGTPVVESPSLTAKPLFLASLHDEFELLNFNQDWVHVRISGLSRGWIWRNSVEMPDGVPDTEAAPENTQGTAADLFHVVREETAQFPGDWEPLKGKSVKIVTVQKIDENAKDAGLKERLEYVKFLFDKNFDEVDKKTSGLAGIVVIFDSADGGMIGATLPALEQWRAGTLSDSALWHKSFFDPPETFDSTGSGASR